MRFKRLLSLFVLLSLCAMLVMSCAPTEVEVAEEPAIVATEEEVAEEPTIVPTEEPVAEEPTVVVTEESEAEPRTVRIEGRDWGYPSPYAFYTRGPGYIRMTFLFDMLLWQDEDEIIPWLAQEWEASEDGKTWTLKLVENATWHDGEPLTADDVKFTFDYMEEYPHPWFNHSIIESVAVTAPYEVKFTLSQPYAVFTTQILVGRLLFLNISGRRLMIRIIMWARMR